ncbi:hypothetical protein I5G58_gp103 [Mycobacterium phage BirdsNest]|uniref:Uncharacterized protein n=1 Tax=Mycobacterium phage BirdsNest TaxID=2686231 RepID=A0A6B9LF87_9CAUD|nr:hypothetical protein I5G58_gp103 [Mycobacterium phage BirdsNest]QHB37405.1 hypothetical protein PBI_BIRDSNEST_103 [Mycobacterium phage BirdsNest]
MAKKIKYTATYEGHTATRTSAREYTHALALHFDGRSDDEIGWAVVSFHGSAELALKAAKDRIWNWRTDAAVAVPVSIV